MTKIAVSAEKFEPENSGFRGDGGMKEDGVSGTQKLPSFSWMS